MFINKEDIAKSFYLEILRNANMEYYSQYCLKPKKVIFNEPATIVLWNDGTKTVVKRQEDDAREFDPEVGYAMCYLKKLLGNTGNFNNIFRNKAYLDALEPMDESSWEDFMTGCQNILTTIDTINNKINKLSAGYKKEEKK